MTHEGFHQNMQTLIMICSESSYCYTNRCSIQFAIKYLNVQRQTLKNLSALPVKLLRCLHLFHVCTLVLGNTGAFITAWTSGHICVHRVSIILPGPTPESPPYLITWRSFESIVCRLATSLINMCIHHEGR